MSDLLKSAIDNHLRVVAALHDLTPQLLDVARAMQDCLGRGGKIVWMGNGGSAADCQHLAAEFVGRFARERSALPALALTTDTSILTAVGNDYGFECIFSRQIQALCGLGDLVVGISTSGNSSNVLKGLQTARDRGMGTVGLTGLGGGQMGALCDHLIAVPSTHTPRIQEAHILIGHILCELIEHAV
ncbi:MAG: D-sedoheptulose 7-phosphate isomerase [Pseudomonadota bacterium]